MRLSLPSDDANITPGGYKAFNVELDCNVADVLNQLSPEDIVNNFYQIDDLIESIGPDSCAYHFGTELLDHFTIDEVLEKFPIEEIIKHIGQDKFKNYIREIFIDKVIDENKNLNNE
jgi:hypothetical protein